MNNCINIHKFSTADSYSTAFRSNASRNAAIRSNPNRNWWRIGYNFRWR